MIPTFFIMIDGLRPDAIPLADCPNLNAFIAAGSSTMNATSVMPSITLPCHTSIFHSVPPTRHGITSNVWTPMARPLPGLIDIAAAAGRTTAVFHNWEPLRNINMPEALTLSFYKNTSYDQDGDNIVAAEAARMIPAHKPDFAFIYLGTVDTWGHAYGWMSDEYLKQIAHVDVQLGVVLNALPADAAVIIQADHGGHDRGHGTDMPEDMTIPWMVRAPGVKAGYTIRRPVSLLDTAPNLAHFLDLRPHAQWEGSVVEEMFE
jgi:predicted AlkP superfamily pyrophosphatase or phosphodiesterase